MPTGFTAAGFDRDFAPVNANGSFNTSDTTTFTTGSKDTLPISTGWQCAPSNNVLSKDDIMNSYAAAYTTGTGDQVIYFGMERNANTGDANVAFWFLQDAVGCDSSNGTASFTGNHKDGDLLIVSAFTKGGDVSNIDVYRWNIPAGETIGSLGTTPSRTVSTAVTPTSERATRLAPSPTRSTSLGFRGLPPTRTTGSITRFELASSSKAA